MNYEGKLVSIKGKGNVFDGKIKGIILPNEDKSVFVVKLDSGYNVAIKKDNVEEIKIIKEGSFGKKEIKKEVVQKEGLPKVAIISMGGTIASKVDYSTGGVSAQFTAFDLINAIPEIKELANIEAYALSNIMSENVSDSDWLSLVKKIEEYVKKGFEGIIVAHGTDTMHFSSAMISFLLEEVGIPVVFVGAQRSSDRPSSDAAYNVLGALSFIVNGKKQGVFVAMHDSMNDNRIAIHLGVKVRKMHSSRRDAFKSINALPVAYVDLELKAGKIHSNKIIFNDELANMELKKIKIFNKISNEVALIKFYPNMSVDILKYLLDNNKIVIIEGTGLGHVASNVIDVLEKTDKIVFMTTQTIYGRVNLNVYTTGRRLLKAGVVSLEDMLPEVAYVKAKYLLAKYNEKNKIIGNMTKNLKGEITYRSLPNEFY